MKRSARMALLAVAAFLCLAPRLDARVFRSWGWWTRPQGLDYDLLGTRVYQAPIVLNGGRGSLSVIHCDDGFAAATARLRQVCQTNGKLLFFMQGGNLGIGLASGQGLMLQMLTVSVRGGNRCLLFLLEQSAEEYQQSHRPPPRHLLTDLPEYPGSEPTFFARNDETHTALATARAAAPPEMVQEFYQTRLTHAGWAAALPGKAGGPQSAAVFLRGTDLCCVTVTPGDSPGDSVITLLQKQLALK